MLKFDSALDKDRRTARFGVEMQHRHFSVIAAIIAQLDLPTRKKMANHFADSLAQTNPKFDRGRFYAACDIKD